MATRIVAPDAGQTTDEMLLLKWHVAVGDTIAVGDFVADLETDKAVLELESHVAGTVLALMAEEGDTVTVGDILLWVGEPGEEIAEPDVVRGSALQGATAVASAVLPLSQASSARERGPGGEDAVVVASPAARTLARERGLDLAALHGSGPDGCIVKRDVLAAGSSVTPSKASARPRTSTSQWTWT